jgi:hypothetical protein
MRVCTVLSQISLLQMLHWPMFKFNIQVLINQLVVCSLRPQVNLYSLVWRRAMASQMEAAELEQVRRLTLNPKMGGVGNSVPLCPGSQG